jgi:hypothetical protein
MEVNFCLMVLMRVDPQIKKRLDARNQFDRFGSGTYGGERRAPAIADTGWVL